MIVIIHLSIQLKTDPLCPACLNKLTSRNVAFFGRFAFCTDCLEDSDSTDPEASVWAMVNYLHSRHLHVSRNLVFFTPQAKPCTPVQELDFITQWFWRQESSFEENRLQLREDQRKLALLQIQKLEH